MNNKCSYMHNTRNITVLNDHLTNVLIDCIIILSSFYNLKGTIKRKNRKRRERERADQYPLDEPRNLGLICNFSRILEVFLEKKHLVFPFGVQREPLLKWNWPRSQTHANQSFLKSPTSMTTVNSIHNQ